MRKQEFDEFVKRFYSAYVNVVRKMDVDPIEFKQFRMRMRIWEEW